MIKFTKFLIIENIEENISNLKSELMDMIRKSLNSSDDKTIEDFISAYKADSEINKIEGLINNSDIYNMYTKHMDEIDEILNSIEFFNKTPNELNVTSMYDYILKGTMEAIDNIID